MATDHTGVLSGWEGPSFHLTTKHHKHTISASSCLASQSSSGPPGWPAGWLAGWLEITTCVTNRCPDIFPGAVGGVREMGVT